MELALTVYLIDVLTNDGGFGTLCAIIAVSYAVYLVVTYLEYDGKPDKKITKLFVWVFTPLFILSVILPSKQTAIYMAGAYFIQEFTETEEAGLAREAIKNQLKAWGEGNDELAPLVQAAGIVLKEKVEQQVEEQK